MERADVIVAVGSAEGVGARVIVRVSGAGAIDLMGGMVEGGVEWAGGAARRGRVCVGGMVVAGWVYVWRGPRSYTGEDAVELHLPGNPLLGGMAVAEVVRRGGRRAGAGEFTARAYLNGRMDLSAAEGVAATIAAGNEAELAAARQLMGGELAKRLGPIMEGVAETLALVEVGIDFVDEDVTFLSSAEVSARVAGVEGELRKLVGESGRMERLSHEPRVVLVGRPNAGKSTLLNALVGSERAVVSAVAGTTRDALEGEVMLASGRVVVVDVAGIDGEGIADGRLGIADWGERGGVMGEIERQMRERALAAVAGADRVVLVREVGDERGAVDVGREPDLVVRTKADLDARAVAGGELAVSAVSGVGMDELRGRLDALAFGGGERVALALNGRHVECIGEALGALGRARESVGAGVEVVAMELRGALDALGGVLGVVTPDELLGRVFSRFCIGK